MVGSQGSDESELESASQELARAIWQTVLLARDESKARGLLGQTTRRRLVDTIMRVLRVVKKQLGGSREA